MARYILVHLDTQAGRTFNGWTMCEVNPVERP